MFMYVWIFVVMTIFFHSYCLFIECVYINRYLNYNFCAEYVSQMLHLSSNSALIVKNYTIFYLLCQ